MELATYYVAKCFIAWALGFTVGYLQRAVQVVIEQAT